ncbi:MAG: CPBP family glutamic-type intramembrane protease, partial [Gemmatimonadota bacterium]
GAVQGAFGWVVATVLFTVLHTGPGSSFRIWTLFAALAGLAFAGLVVWRQTLLAAIVAHVVVNAVNLHHLTSLRASELPVTTPGGRDL